GWSSPNWPDTVWSASSCQPESGLTIIAGSLIMKCHSAVRSAERIPYSCLVIEYAFIICYDFLDVGAHRAPATAPKSAPRQPVRWRRRPDLLWQTGAMFLSRPASV